MTAPVDSSTASPVVLITGASSGVGLALACVLASQGVRLVLTARRLDRLERVRDHLAEHSVPIIVHACDVADAEAMSAAFEKAEELGALTGVVNNAGVLQPVAPVEDVDLTEFDRHLRTNVVGVVCGIRLALEFRGAGVPLRVVNISSGAATRAIKGWAAYCASKAAVNQVTEVAAMENADGNTSIVAVAPGIIETAMQRSIRETDESRFPDVAHFVALKEQGMLLHPVEASLALAWLVLGAPLELSGSFVDARADDVQKQVSDWLAGRGEASEVALQKARAWFEELESLGA